MLQIIATALQVISNCVTASPSLAYLLPAPGTAATAAAAAADKPLEAHQTPVAADLATSADQAVRPTQDIKQRLHSSDSQSRPSQQDREYPCTPHVCANHAGINADVDIVWLRSCHMFCCPGSSCPRAGSLSSQVSAGLAVTW